MTFGDKIKKLRLEKNLSQQELAKLVGKSSRTITSYEIGASHPRTREMYDKLAEVLEVNVNYLLADGEEFMLDVGEQFGRKGQLQAASILNQTRELFAGGSLSERDQVAFLTVMQEIFLDSKKEAKKFDSSKSRKSRKNGNEESE